MFYRPYTNNSNELFKKNNNNKEINIINNFQSRRAKSLDKANLKPRSTPLFRDKNLYYGNKPKGLQNIGATCYMNATLQCFFHVLKLTKYLSENKYTYDGIQIKPNSIAYEYIKLIKELSYKNGQVDYAPYDFKEIIGQKNSLFAGISANDSKDLIMFILEELSKDLAIKKKKSIYGKNNEYDGFVDQTDERASFKETVKQFEKDVSIIKDLFYFMIKTESLCQNCRTKIYNFQVMNFIIFPLKKAYEDSKNMTNTYMLNNIMNNMINMNNINSMNSMPSMNYNNNFNNNYGFGNNNMKMNRFFSMPSPSNRPLLNIMSNMSNSNSNINMNYNMNSFQNYQNNNNQMNGFFNSNRNKVPNYDNMLNKYNQDIKNENNFNSNYNRNNQNNRFMLNNLNSNRKNESENYFRKPSKITKEQNNFNSFTNNAQNIFPGNNINRNNNRNNFNFSNQQNNNNYNNNNINYNNNNFINYFNNPNGEIPVRLLNGKGGYGPYDMLIHQKKENKGPKLTLDQCFESYLKPDFLTGDNKQYCNRCHVLSDAYYTTHIYSSPNILILILNYDKGILFKCDVLFDEYINISKYIEAKNTNVPNRYRLLGAIVHIGPSSMGGHFIAFCRGIENREKWYKCNDSLVSESTFSEIKSVGIPYVLFYENCDAY